MTTLLQKVYRNIGTRQQFQWRDRNLAVIIGGAQAFPPFPQYAADPFVVITAGPATFDATPVAPVTFDLTLYKAAATPVTFTVTLTGAETTRNLIAAKINADAFAADPAFTGALEPCIAESSLVLYNPWHIQVALPAGGAGRDSLGVHGFPNLTRDVSAALLTAYTADIGVGMTQNNNVSEPIAVPDGANVVTLWPSVASMDTAQGYQKSPAISPLWSNGVEGAASAFFPSYPGDYNITNDPPNNGVVSGVMLRQSYLLTPGVAGAADLFVASGPLTLTVPAGATEMRLMYIPSYASITEVPRRPSKIACAATFGAR